MVAVVLPAPLGGPAIHAAVEQVDTPPVRATVLTPAPIHAAGKQIVVTTSIQAAVNAAQPGDTVRVPPGTYRENVVVAKDNISIVGSAGAILDGTGLAGTTGIRVAKAAPARVNEFRLTGLQIQNFSRTGVILIRVDDFQISHGVYRDNHTYGVFPIASSRGVIDFNRVSGSDDAGIYVGQSTDVVVEKNHVSDNTVGIEIENSARIEVRDNIARNNTLGVVLALVPGLAVKTLAGIVVTKNELSNNNRPNPVTDPTELLSFLPSGVGILNIAGDRVVIEKNVANHNNSAGIAIGRLPPPFAALDPALNPLPDANRVRDNVAQHNGDHPDPKLAPLPGADLLWDGSGTGNCWLSNVFKMSFLSPLPPCS